MKLCGDVVVIILEVHTKFEAIRSSFALVSRHWKKTV